MNQISHTKNLLLGDKVLLLRLRESLHQRLRHLAVHIIISATAIATAFG